MGLDGGADLPAGLAVAWGVRGRPPRGPKPGLSLERIVSACLQPDAERRYQKTEELAADLDGLDEDGHPATTAGHSRTMTAATLALPSKGWLSGRADSLEFTLAGSGDLLRATTNERSPSPRRRWSESSYAVARTCLRRSLSSDTAWDVALNGS